MFEMIKKTFIRYPLIIVIVVITAWVGYPYYLKWVDNPLPQTAQQNSTATEDTTPAKTELENIGLVYGTYGDSYGSLNTLFSGLAFAMLIMSLLMQREELQAQRKELEEQRKEIKESNKIAEGQREITEQQATLIKQQIDEAKVQNFYFVLFKYFENLDQIKNNGIYDSQTRRFTELELIFKQVSKQFIQLLSSDLASPNNDTYENKLSTLNTFYITISNELNFEIHNNLYFKNILMILKFIKENEQVNNKHLVINIFLSHLNMNILLTLTWIAILQESELKKFIEQYGLLRHFQLTRNRLVTENLKIFITEKAFQEP